MTTASEARAGSTLTARSVAGSGSASTVLDGALPPPQPAAKHARIANVRSRAPRIRGRAYADGSRRVAPRGRAQLRNLVVEAVPPRGNRRSRSTQEEHSFSRNAAAGANLCFTLGRCAGPVPARASPLARPDGAIHVPLTAEQRCSGQLSGIKRPFDGVRALWPGSRLAFLKARVPHIRRGTQRFLGHSCRTRRGHGDAAARGEAPRNRKALQLRGSSAPCAEEDSNLHECYLTRPSTLRVYQFRHRRRVGDGSAESGTPRPPLDSVRAPR